VATSPQRGQAQFADVFAVDPDLALGDVIEPGQQRGEDRLARTVEPTSASVSTPTVASM
jgi:hypothetical protein